MFNPCLFRGYVYVCGQYSYLVEAFSPQTDSFLPLHLQLPENTDCCLYVHNNCLVVHSSEYISKFAAGQEGQLIQCSDFHSQRYADKYSNSQPVIDPYRKLFFILQDGICVSLSMETGLKVCSFS